MGSAKQKTLRTTGLKRTTKLKKKKYFLLFDVAGPSFVSVDTANTGVYIFWKKEGLA